MEVTTTYRIRPHHGMCLYFFEGKGYSEGFTKHMAEVKEWLLGKMDRHSCSWSERRMRSAAPARIIRVAAASLRRR